MWIALFILLTAASVFFGTSAASARIASQTALTELLEGRRGELRLASFFGRRREYVRTAQLLQMLFLVLFVFALDVRLNRLSFTGTEWHAWYWSISAAWLIAFGVAVPAAWSRYSADAFIARVLPILDVVRAMSRPLLSVINAIDEIVRRLAGAPRDAHDATDRIEREILDVVTQGETEGAVDAAERDMIRSVMVLDETSAGEIMTPRTDIVGIEAAASFDDVRRLVLTDGHSRIPVFEESLDHIIGVLYAKDLLRIEEPGRFQLRDVMREVTFVPETKDVASLLREFQSRRVHIAIVLDEYGGTAGLVTLEDIFEQLVGDIADEHEQPEAPSILRVDERTVEIDARTRVEELNELLDVTIPDDEAYDTVGGFVFARLGRIPSAGESLVEKDVHIDILEADERTLGRLRVRVLEPAPQESQA